MPKATKRVSFP